MIIKTRFNNYIGLDNFSEESLDDDIKQITKDYIIIKKNKLFFNFNRIFLFNNYYIFYNYTLLNIRKKRSLWNKISYELEFKHDLSSSKSGLYKKMWLKSIKNFSKIQNKYTIYIKYFYTYKSFKFKNLTW